MQVVYGIILYQFSIINCLNARRGFAVDIDSYGIIETVGRIDRLENDVRDVLDSGLTAKSQGAEFFVLSKDEIIGIDLGVI